MPSPFPGMDPYIEQPSFWSSFHFRLIGTIAAAIEPQLSPKYYIEVKTRAYQSDNSEELLIGIPDVAVIARQPTQELPVSKTATPVTTQIRPERVMLPMPVPIKERYLCREPTATPAYHPNSSQPQRRGGLLGSARGVWPGLRRCPIWHPP
ncbi:hypothetical protein XM38_031300 [Halomicronema hongdechloris C2206]|uniref:DUF4058 domain-containing protein n=1 Tax=Halomicronema hongdechloris C2206 TaxID=1641165 RepID=A0A1Z3HPJ3_9CYAN|nr:hypothetical protein XM38_031300 [Halomicronema hongdechloris C2206]